MSLLVLLAAPFAFADDRQEAGVTPDSIFWGLDNALDNLGMLIAFDHEAKAERGLEIARERLFEVKVMAERNRIEDAEKAEIEHNRILVEVKNNIRLMDESKSFSNLEQKIFLHEDSVSKARAEIEFQGQALTEDQRMQIISFFDNIRTVSGDVKIEIKNRDNRHEIEIEIENENDRQRNRGQGNDNSQTNDGRGNGFDDNSLADDSRGRSGFDDNSASDIRQEDRRNDGVGDDVRREDRRDDGVGDDVRREDRRADGSVDDTRREDRGSSFDDNSPAVASGGDVRREDRRNDGVGDSSRREDRRDA